MLRKSTQLSIGFSIIMIIVVSTLNLYFYQENLRLKDELEKSQSQVERLQENLKLEEQENLKLKEELERSQNQVKNLTKKLEEGTLQERLEEESTKEEVANWRIYKSDNLKVYENEEAGFRLEYPSEISFNIISPATEVELPIANSDMILSIWVRKIETMREAMTLGHDKSTAVKDQKALEKGEFGENIDFALDFSKEVVKINNQKYGKKFLVLGRFDACDVTFEREFIFYNKGYQIIITLRWADKDKIVTQMPNYFTVNKEGCGKPETWVWGGYESMKNFYYTLKNGNGCKEAQEWYDTFDKIVETIKIL